jgi:transcription factor SFP1
MTLPTLHDLLQHYEESHAQQNPQSLRAGSSTQQAKESQPNSKAAIASQAASSVQQQAQQQQRQQQQQTGRSQSSGLKIGQPVTGTSSLTGGIQRMRQQQHAQPSTPTQQAVQTVDVEMDGVEDMEMDDDVGPLDSTPETPINQRSGQQAQPSLFGQPQRPKLNLTNSTGMLHQGLRTSQPTTPASSGFNFQNNPTVSSVNTPTLTTQPLQQQNQNFSPDTSIPGTPADMDEDYNSMAMNMNLGNMNTNMGNMNLGYGFGNRDLGLDLCIDEPAKRLFSPNGGFNNQGTVQQQFVSFGLGGQLGNEDLLRRFQQQHTLQYQAFPNASGGMMVGEEHKQFRCPVIGCEKAYKNQNGLKYMPQVYCLWMSY